MAEQLKITSIAIPAMSTGLYGFPKDLCAKIFKEGISEYPQTSR